MNAAELLALDPVIPVVTVDDASNAVPLARALLAGGLRTLEITLRTSAALGAIRAVACEVPDIVVGAGTLTAADQAEAAARAGAAFLLSPGQTPALLDAMAGTGLLYIPGGSGPSDLLALLERGVAHMKLFPAEPIGGVAMAKALAGPFPGVRLVPTGGVGPESAAEYLELPNVACVGGSWIAPPALLAAKDWDAIARRAHRCADLRRQAR